MINRDDVVYRFLPPCFRQNSTPYNCPTDQGLVQQIFSTQHIADSVEV